MYILKPRLNGKLGSMTLIRTNYRLQLNWYHVKLIIHCKVKSGESPTMERWPTKPKFGRNSVTKASQRIFSFGFWYLYWVNECIPCICFSGRISARFRPCGASLPLGRLAQLSYKPITSLTNCIKKRKYDELMA